MRSSLLVRENNSRDGNDKKNQANAQDYRQTHVSEKRESWCLLYDIDLKVCYDGNTRSKPVKTNFVGPTCTLHDLAYNTRNPSASDLELFIFRDHFEISNDEHTLIWD